MSDIKIYVLGYDNGCEGKTEPVMAFRSLEEAEAAKRLIESNPSATAVYLAEVPVWNTGPKP